MKSAFMLQDTQEGPAAPPGSVQLIQLGNAWHIVITGVHGVRWTHEYSIRSWAEKGAHHARQVLSGISDG